MDVVLATRNEGKLREMQRLFEPLGLTLVSQASLNIESAEETRSTFVENALDKARHVSALTGKPCIADDSGLVVRALGGAPGIYSARFAGPDATDAANNTRLIGELAGVEDRSAHFYCAMVYLEHADHPAPLVATGRWNGEIVDTPRGENGFGYDPHFLVAGLNQTSAQLDPEQKNTLSHRGQASRALLALLQ